MATVETLLTAEEFRLTPDNGQRTELVRGRIVVMNLPGFRHAEVCSNAFHILGSFVREHGLGRVVSNDPGVLTARDPDTVRGPDLAFYSFARLPKDSHPEGYPTVAPDVVIEVRSPSNRWPDLHAKVAEYLNAGVVAVCVLDPQTGTVNVFHAEQPTQTLTDDDELSFPNNLLGEFRAAVSRFFE